MLYNSYPNWTFGIECETAHKISMQKNKATDKYPVISSAPIIEFFYSDNRIMFVYPDMGDDKMRTAEIVTEPIRIADFSVHQACKLVIKFLLNEFNLYLDKTITKEAFTTDFTAFQNITENLIVKGFEVKFIPCAIEIHGSQSNQLCNQISFGLPMTDFNNFVAPILFPDDVTDWYHANRHDNLYNVSDDEKEKFAFNYLLCVLKKYCEILNSERYNKNLDCPAAKNSWRFMPRTPPALVLDTFSNEQKQRICAKLKESLLSIAGANEADAAAFAFDNIIMRKSAVGGHVKTLRDLPLPNNEKMFVFEIRSPDNNFDEYFVQ